MLVGSLHAGRSVVRWLRPAKYQARDRMQTEDDLAGDLEVVVEMVAEPAQGPISPKSMPDQAPVMCNLLVFGPQSAEALNAHFKRKPTKSVTQGRAAIDVLCQAQQDDGRWQLL